MRAKDLSWDDLGGVLEFAGEKHAIMRVIIYENDVFVSTQHGHVKKFSPDEEVVFL